MKLTEMGLTSAWQQSQERLNRELKANRLSCGSRTMMSLLDEVRQLVQSQKDVEILALQGCGPHSVVPPVEAVSKIRFLLMSHEEKDALYADYLTSQPGNLIAECILNRLIAPLV